MSSAVLYLAIVAVWGIVLVPMWLRRDGDGIGRLLHRRNEVLTSEPLDDDAPHTRDDDVVMETAGEAGLSGRSELHEGEPAFREPARRRVTRGAVIARRRRRTLGLTLLTLTAIVLTSLHVTPWWFVFPPMFLLGGHLSLLRVAVRMDQVRRAELRRAAARAERLRLAREEREEREAKEASEAKEAAARTAEVIELPSLQEEVYDQYTDRRAVGD